MRETLESLVKKVEVLVDRVCTELIPPLKWSSWEMDDMPPPLDDIQSWYSALVDSIVGLSSELKTCAMACDIPGICSQWTTHAPKVASEVSNGQKNLEYLFF